MRKRPERPVGIVEVAWSFRMDEDHLAVCKQIALRYRMPTKYFLESLVDHVLGLPRTVYTDVALDLHDVRAAAQEARAALRKENALSGEGRKRVPVKFPAADVHRDVYDLVGEQNELNRQKFLELLLKTALGLDRGALVINLGRARTAAQEALAKLTARKEALTREVLPATA